MKNEWEIRNKIIELLEKKGEGFRKRPYRKGTKIDIEIKALRWVLDKKRGGAAERR